MTEGGCGKTQPPSKSGNDTRISEYYAGFIGFFRSCGTNKRLSVASLPTRPLRKPSHLFKKMISRQFLDSAIYSPLGKLAVRAATRAVQNLKTACFHFYNRFKCFLRGEPGVLRRLLFSHINAYRFYDLFGCSLNFCSGT